MHLADALSRVPLPLVHTQVTERSDPELLECFRFEDEIGTESSEVSGALPGLQHDVIKTETRNDVCLQQL